MRSWETAIIGVWRVSSFAKQETCCPENDIRVLKHKISSVHEYFIREELVKTGDHPPWAHGQGPGPSHFTDLLIITIKIGLYTLAKKGRQPKIALHLTR